MTEIKNAEEATEIVKGYTDMAFSGLSLTRVDSAQFDKNSKRWVVKISRGLSPFISYYTVIVEPVEGAVERFEKRGLLPSFFDRIRRLFDSVRDTILAATYFIREIKGKNP